MVSTTSIERPESMSWAPSEAQFIDMTLAMHAGGGHRRCV